MYPAESTITPVAVSEPTITPTNELLTVAIAEAIEGVAVLLGKRVGGVVEVGVGTGVAVGRTEMATVGAGVATGVGEGVGGGEAVGVGVSVGVVAAVDVPRLSGVEVGVASAPAHATPTVARRAISQSTRERFRAASVSLHKSDLNR